MEPNRKRGASQNCFLPTADHRAVSVVGNGNYVHDEAESLMYVCSETSMPPQSAGNVRGLRSSEMSSAGGASLVGSTSSHRKTRKSSTTAPTESPPSADGAVLPQDMASVFKSEILSKFKEFAITPSSSCSIPDEFPKVNSKSGSRENKIENESKDVEELFIHKTNFFTSSSDIDKVQIASEYLQDEEFSTGMSDMDEAAKGTGNIKRKSEEKDSLENMKTSDLPPWFATKSIIKNVDAIVRSPAASASPNRIGPPVQGRLSLRTMKTSPPCFCLLDEIRKNDLVMREDIFSSSSHKAVGFPDTHTEVAGRSGSNNNGKDRGKHKSRDVETANISTKQNITCGFVDSKMNDMRHRQTTSEPVEVYEAIGGEGKGVDATANQQQQTMHQAPVTTVDSEVSPIKHSIEKLKQPASSNTLRSCGTSETTNQRVSDQMNDYLEAKTSTPNRRPEKYVKLPGLADAFVQRESVFKDLRIKDGTSFESINALQEMSTRNIANQILKMKKRKEYEDLSMMNIIEQILELKKGNVPRLEEHVTTQTKLETKDAATDLRIPLVNTKTQTADSNKIMVDCFVQCESHIIDEANARNVVANDHQEIMVCDDNGDGVQLYNELGHPLTDMDGYLLKDTLGRFLVRLDQYGVPISCTNGQRIFMEDSTAWDAVKNTLSIVHQSRKKPMKRSDTVRKCKARPSLRQLETAMNNLKNTLEWADKISIDSSQEHSLNQFTNRDAEEPSRLRKPTLVAAKLNNNSTSLIAEMKSIARLRNELLEKVNFIVDNRNVGKAGKNTKFPAKKSALKNKQESRDWLNSASIWQAQDRPYSPTYQAMKKLKNESNNEASAWTNFGLSRDLLAINKREGHSKNAGMDWIGAKSAADDFSSKKHFGGFQPKIEAPWVNEKFEAVEKLYGNEANKDMWDFINLKANNTRASKIGTNTDKLPIAQTRRFGALDEDLLSEMRLVSKDTNLPNVSNLKNANQNPALTGTQLLNSIEKDYNLRIGDIKMEPWENEESQPSGLPDRSEQAGKWSQKRPSVEFSSSNSNM